MLYLVEQRPHWETNSRSPTQEILRLLRNQMLHYRVYQNLLPVPILSHMNPLSTPNLFFKIYIVVKHIRRTPTWLLLIKFPIKFPNAFLLYIMRATCTAHLNLLHLSPQQYVVKNAKLLTSALLSLPPLRHSVLKFVLSSYSRRL